MAVRMEKIDPSNPSPALLQKAAALIKKGKVIACPTDTGYAFAANAIDIKAVTRVFILKGRAYANPIHVAVYSLEAADKYAYMTKAAELLAKRYLPGGLTLVLRRREVIPPLLVAGKDTIGIRIPDNKIILSLAEMTDLPITATSANPSGKPTPYSAQEVIDQMGETIGGVDLILDQGALASRGLSTIVDLTMDPPQLIRQGVISWLEIRQFLQSLSQSP